MEITEDNSLNKNQEGIKKVYAFLISLVFVSLLLTIIYFSNGFTFFVNDDKNINNLISGKYVGEPTHYGIYVSQIVCQLLKFLYRINPNIPFYGILFVLTIGICCVIFCYNIIKDKENRILNSIFLVSFIFIFLFYHIINIQFTLVAIFPMCAVISLIFSFPKKRYAQVLYFILILILCLLSISIRINCFLMSIPFICLLLLYKFCKDKKQLWFCITFACILVLTIGLNAVVDKLAFRNDKEYAYYLEYNNVRSQLYDFYGYPKYDEAKKLYDDLGISREGYDLIVNHYVLDLDDASLENMKALLEYQKSKVNKGNRFIGSIKVVKDTLEDSNNIHSLNYLIFLLIIALILNKKNKPLDIVFLVLLLFGSYSFAVLISYLMKFPDRICSSLLILTTACLLFWFKQKEKRTFPKGKLAIILSVGLYVSCVVLFGLVSSKCVNISTNFYQYSASCNSEKYLLEDYIRANENDVFFLDGDVNSKYTDQVLHKNIYIDNMVYCSWSSRSPYANMIIRKLGYNSLDDLFANCDNLKLILKDNGSITSFSLYFQNHYGRELELADKFSDKIFIYKVI